MILNIVACQSREGWTVDCLEVGLGVSGDSLGHAFQALVWALSDQHVREIELRGHADVPDDGGGK